jgi:very-short-patch-repair endonuclease
MARRLIVEVDGGQHALRMDRDASRTRYLEQQGFQVMRFWNPDVLRDTDGVIATIHAVLVERRGLETGENPSLPSP